MSNDLIDKEQLKEEYIRLLDPTEYYYATKIFGSYSKWESFVRENKELVDSWRRELEAKIKSMCVSLLIETSKGDTRDSLQAAKFLLDIPWKKEENKRGRPSNVDVENELRRIANVELQVQEDLARITNDIR